MSSTKEKILETALQLFNERGVPQVSLRTISNEMEISLGNLTYHFKKRDDIIEALYLRLVERMSASIKDNTLSNPLRRIFNISDTMAANFYEFRFIMLDFVLITRGNSMIRTHYQKLLHVRKQQFDVLVSELIDAKYIREELIKGEYDYLFKSLRIISDFWLSTLAIDKNTITKNSRKEYTRLLKLKIFPYLTKKGRLEFSKIA